MVGAFKRWHCYIHGKSSSVCTDHSALQCLRSYKNLTDYTPRGDWVYASFSNVRYNPIRTIWIVRVNRHSWSTEFSKREVVELPPRNKHNYDKKFQPLFEVGDQVLLKVAWHPNNGRLTQVLGGPFTIIRKLSPVTYEVCRENRQCRKKSTINHSKQTQTVLSIWYF